jgi:hypothetical protein
MAENPQLSRYRLYRGVGALDAAMKVTRMKACTHSAADRLKGCATQRERGGEV